MTDIIKSIQISHISVVGRVCNFCGKEDRSTFPIGGVMRIDFEYGSKYDGESWYFWVCDECSDKLFKDKKNNGNIVEKDL